MERYSTENGPCKVTKYFSLLLDGKLTCSLHRCGHVIFGRGTNRQIKKYGVSPKLPNLMPAKFSRYTVFFRKSDSDISEVIMKRRQQDSQAKAAKCCSTEKRQQEPTLWQLSVALQRRDSKSPRYVS